MAGYTRPSFARHLTEEPVEDGEAPTTQAGVAQAGIVFPSLERADELVPDLPTSTTLSSHKSEAQSALTSSDKLSALPSQALPSSSSLGHANANNAYPHSHSHSHSNLHSLNRSPSLGGRGRSSSVGYGNRSPSSGYGNRSPSLGRGNGNRSPRLSFGRAAGAGTRTPSTRSPTPTRAYHRSFDAGPVSHLGFGTGPGAGAGAGHNSGAGNRSGAARGMGLGGGEGIGTTSVSVPNIALASGGGGASNQVPRSQMYTFAMRAADRSEGGSGSVVTTRGRKGGPGGGVGTESPTKNEGRGGQRVSFDSEGESERERGRERERTERASGTTNTNISTNTGTYNSRHAGTLRQPAFPVSASDPGTLAHSNAHAYGHGHGYSPNSTYAQRDRESLTSLIATRLQQLHDTVNARTSDHGSSPRHSHNLNQQHQSQSQSQHRRSLSRQSRHRDSPRPPSLTRYEDQNQNRTHGHNYNRSRSHSRRESAQGHTPAIGTSAHQNQNQNQNQSPRLRTLSPSSRAASPLRSLLDRISLPIHGLRDRERDGRGIGMGGVDERLGRGRGRGRRGHGHGRRREREELFVPVDPWRTLSSDVEGGMGLGFDLGIGMGWLRWPFGRGLRKQGKEGDVERQTDAVKDGEADGGVGERTEGEEIRRVNSLVTSPSLSNLPIELEGDIESLNLSCPVPSCALPLPFCPHFASLRTHARPPAAPSQPLPHPDTTTHPAPPSVHPPLVPVRTKSTTASSWLTFLSDTVPRQIYLHLLMRLPRMYFGRVARIFEDAEVSRPDVGRLRELVGVGGIGGVGAGERMGDFEDEVDREVDREMEWMGEREFGPYGYGYGGYRDYYEARSPYEVRSPRSTHERLESQSRGRAGEGVDERGRSMTMRSPRSGRERDVRSPGGGDADDWDDGMSRVEAGMGMGVGVGAVSPALVRFKRSWETFVDSLIKEWKTFNLVSALLLSAILTMFQIPTAAVDTVVRTPALLSMVCALMSLCYGCVYIVRFGTMRGMGRASRWAEEAQKTKTSILWNVWVLLAAPAIWLAWSMIAFIIAILAYVWRSGSTADPSSNSAESAGDGGGGGGAPNTNFENIANGTIGKLVGSGAFGNGSGGLVGGEGSGNGGAEDAQGGTDGGRVLDAIQAIGPRVAVTAVVVLGLVWFGLIVRTFRRYGDGYARKHEGSGGAEGGRREREREEREGLLRRDEDHVREREGEVEVEDMDREEAERRRGRSREVVRDRAGEVVEGTAPTSEEQVMSPVSGVQGLGLVNLDVRVEPEEKDANEGDGDGVFVVGDEDEKEGDVDEVKDAVEVEVDEKGTDGMQSMESLDGHPNRNDTV